MEEQAASHTRTGVITTVKTGMYKYCIEIVDICCIYKYDSLILSKII